MTALNNTPCEVECYAGARADQWPLRFRVRERQVAIARIDRCWRTPEEEAFEVLGADGERYRLRRDWRSEQWTATQLAP